MNNEQEIEKMAFLLVNDILLEHNAEEAAKHLINNGIGDKKQAVKEAFDKLSKRLTDKVQSICYCDIDINLVEIEDTLQIIDELFTELYGEGL